MKTYGELLEENKKLRELLKRCKFIIDKSVKESDRFDV